MTAARVRVIAGLDDDQALTAVSGDSIAPAARDASEKQKALFRGPSAFLELVARAGFVSERLIHIPKALNKSG